MKSHRDWTEALKRILANPDKAHAARELEAVAKDLEPLALGAYGVDPPEVEGSGFSNSRSVAPNEDGLSAWHFVQTLSLAATLFEQAGAKSDAERALEAAYLPSAHRVVEATRAHAEIAARLATLLFERGDEERGRLVVGEVFQAFAHAPAPSLAIEQLLTEWRRIQR